jgi:hypothetical protein
VAFYSQLPVFCNVFVAYSLLKSWPDLVSSVMAVAAAFVWWLGVVRDHQKDDVKYLQGHIVCHLQGRAEVGGCLYPIARAPRSKQCTGNCNNIVLQVAEFACAVAAAQAAHLQALLRAPCSSVIQGHSDSG